MNKKISQLDLVTNLGPDDVLPIVNEGVTKKVKISQFPSGETNLSYLPDPLNGVVDNDNGTNAVIPLATNTDAGLFSPIEKTKLEGIEDDAQKNVNADWNAVSGDAEILNKPSIPDPQVNSDWNSVTGVSEILNKPSIPTATSDLTNDSGFITIGDVPPQQNSDWNATSGVTEILNKPTIPASQIQSDWTQSNNTLADFIKNKPTIPAEQVNSDWNATSGKAEILNKPIIPSISGLATVTYVDDQDALKVDKIAGKGLSENDFTNTLKTKLDGIQDGAEVNVNADWNAISGDAQILNKPTIPPAQVNSDWNSVSGVSEILNKPTIPPAQVNSDWNATSGVAQILNKPTIPSSSTFVPYTGATANVNLGEFGLSAGQVNLDLSPTGTPAVGTTYWNDAIGTPQTLLKGGNVTIKNGVDLITRVVNKTVPATNLQKDALQVVRISGSQGQRLAIDLALGDSDLNSAETIGIPIETIAPNQEGYIMTVGQIENVNTTGANQGETWIDGDVLYLSPIYAGQLTKQKPSGYIGGHIVVVGYVEYAHAINGRMYVKVMNGWELEELHDVAIQGPQEGQFLRYNQSISRWENSSKLISYKDIQSQNVYVAPVLTEQLISASVIDANSFNISDIMRIIAKPTKPNGTASVNIRIRHNTTFSLAGSSQIAFYTYAPTANTVTIERSFIIYLDTGVTLLAGNSFTLSLLTDVTASLGDTVNIPFDPTITNYIFLTMELGVTTDGNFIAPQLMNIRS